MPQPQVSMCTYTPDKAQTILDTRNPANRLISGVHMSKIADDMRNGRFDSHNGEAIRFDTNGNLIDGQHRLAAIVDSGVAIELLTMKGLAPESRHTIDQGRRRSVSDRLRMEDIIDKYRAKHVSAVRFLLGMHDGVLTAPKVSDARIFDWISANVEKIARLNENMTDISRGRFSQAGFLTAAYTLDDIDPEMMLGFFRELTTNSGDPYTATRALYTRVSEDRRRNLKSAESYYLTIRAWNDWLDNKNVRRYRIPSQLTMNKLPVPKRA